ncbi:protein translocase subunit SecF [Halocalculus aciditolerans]|uniref:Protein-export membrane protein SecF n=1 Tax=Halocalculus aciditolerans TaxID=1383812 RepID=A0A830F7M3_9EURY|nr:protein translocase subunit SecF [Halocalculus aciditolerans]GGL47776.1 preprotein translocase subunit SecF [Halocalculus aciditolerans]
MPSFEIPEVDFSRYSNRQLASVPLALIALALVVLVAWTVVFGHPVTPGFEFTGGTEITVQAAGGQPAIQQAFSAEITSIQPVRSQADTYIVTFQSTNLEQLTQSANAAFGAENVLSKQSVSPSFGASAQQTAVFGLGVAFAGMAIVVFALFRTLVPSGAVVVSALGDILVPMALMNVFGIKLSLGTVAALLMLIGYSVDSDILLTNHVLRRSGGFYESVDRAMKTGVTMTVTSLCAMAVMAVVAYLFGIDLMASIGIILVFGLATDLVNTYMLNLSLLRWYKYEGVAR